MLQKHKLLLLILLFSIIIVALGVILYRDHSPTIRSFLTINKKAAFAERQKRIQKILPYIQTKNGFRFLYMDTSYYEQTPYTEIRNCFPVPYINNIRVNNPVKFKNSSGENIMIKLLGGSYTIPAQKGVALQINFPSIPNLYEYFCNNSLQPAGYLYVTR